MTTTGIDFGTTNSVVAQWNGEFAEVLELGAYGLDADWRRPGFDLLFPSVVGTSSLRDGTLFGWEAKLRSEEAVEASKRLLRSEEFVTVGGRRFAATTTAAGIFRKMAELAEREAATTIDSAVVTVPANATGAARFRTREAARFAGIKVKMLLNEPTSAAISYVHGLPASVADGQFLVFDWGGGTMDATILVHDSRLRFLDEKASRGVNKLGGIELDARLRRLVLERTPPQPRWTPSQERQFALDIERSKILLSQQPSVLVPTPDGSLVEITQAEFENEIQDLITRALDPVEECLDDLRMDPDEITAVLMIGGSSQIPAVRDAVADALDCELVDPAKCNPLTAVARGAAITAATLNGELDGVVQVVNSHALGTRITDDSGRRSFGTVIPRRSPLPRKLERSYTPHDARATSLKVEVWEGDPDRPLDDTENFKLDTLTLKYPADHDQSNRSFRLQYTYDADGLLQVKAWLEGVAEPILDQTVDSFGGAGVPPEVARELDVLLAAKARGRNHLPEPTHLPLIPQPSTPRPAAAAGTPRPTAPRPKAGTTAPLIVDGSNLAWVSAPSRQAGGLPSMARLQHGIAELRRRYPGRAIHVVVDATLRHDVTPEERAAVDRAIDSGTVVQPPAGTEGRGDALVLDIASQVDGIVVSNDNFAPFQDRHPWLRLQGRVLGATLSQGVWVFSPRTPPSRRR
ncbi:Hsp70 family protein [Kitasatospora purpeofusca]|uniref:Hsp70 family protein n=1 Tax=Kitasatospora purpeofusca TaxID=67352 RepID=UPI002A59C2F8|nr:Hsp70 family protein [Kitasatospora purpeofusca]MDY0812387.1 Hsp70 family protein [Kitasatospora purpeofusca]